MLRPSGAFSGFVLNINVFGEYYTANNGRRLCTRVDHALWLSTAPSRATEPAAVGQSGFILVAGVLFISDRLHRWLRAYRLSSAGVYECNLCMWCVCVVGVYVCACVRVCVCVCMCVLK